MRRNHFLSDPRDRARSAAATAAIHLLLGGAFLTGLALQPERRREESLKTFDVPPPPPPPFEASPTPVESARPAPVGRRADPSPIVAPHAPLPTAQPIAAAPVAGSGSSSSAGAAASGSGSGAGGTGSGRGSGIGTEARLLSGNRGRVPRRLLQPFAADRGYAHLLLTVGEAGRVTDCAIIQGTGSDPVDQAMCQVMVQQSRWQPALDPSGRPVSVQLRYTSTWSK